MSDDNNIYGPYTLPNVSVEPEVQLSMPPLQGQGRTESTMSPVEMLLLGSGSLLGRSVPSITNYGLKQSNPYRKMIDSIKRLRSDKRYKKLMDGVDMASKVVDQAFDAYAPLSLMEKTYYIAKEAPGTQIYGADPNNPMYTTGRYADDYYIENNNVYHKPEVEFDWLLKNIFTGDSDNRRFPSRYSILEDAVKEKK